MLRFAELDELDDVRVIKISHDLDFLKNVRSLQKKLTSAAVLGLEHELRA